MSSSSSSTCSIPLKLISSQFGFFFNMYVVIFGCLLSNLSCSSTFFNIFALDAGFDLPFPFNWLLEPHTTLVSGFGVGLLGLGGGFGVRFWFGNGLLGFGDGCVGGW